MSLIYRVFTYFRRGHAVYLALGISVLNFITIQYTLFIQQTSLKTIFTDPAAFAVLFGVTYLTLAVLIGWYDMRRGSLAVELGLNSSVNPYNLDVARFNLLLLKIVGDGSPESVEARRLMEKWIK